MKTEYKKQLQKLIDLGLTEREAKVYVTLLSKKGFTTLELQNSVDIPRTKIYEVLQRMLARGICSERGIGKVKYYEAVEPKVAFKRIINEYQENCITELNNRKSLAENVTGLLTPLFEENKDISYNLDFVEVFKDTEQIQRKYLQSLKETKISHYTFNKGPYVCDTSSRLTEQIKEEGRLLKRGVLCKNIFEQDELFENEWLLNYVKKQSKLGQLSVAVNALPIKMMVFDEHKVFFPLLKPSYESSIINMIFIEHKELAKACIMLFNFIWVQGQQIK
ncbi:MAG: helix-turn-helix domain-containing protein [Candidatus Kapaibacterium sp.]